MYQNKIIKNIKIDDFRTISNCELELGKTNILIGAHGAGKSSFIDALEARGYPVFRFSNLGGIRAPQQLDNSCILRSDAANLAALLYKLRQDYPTTYKSIISLVNLAAPFFDDFIFEQDNKDKNLIVLKWKQSDTDSALSADLISDGLLRFICLAVLFRLPADLIPPVIIIDEPETELDNFTLQLLAEMLTSVKAGTQLIFSTKSAQLLDFFDPEDIIFVERLKNESCFKRLDAEKVRKWLDDGYSLSELWLRNAFTSFTS